MSNLNNIHVKSVVLLYNNGQFKEALNEINLLNKQFPNEPLLYNLLGACHKALGQFELALQKFETASKIKPDYAEAFFNQAIIYQELNNYAEAIPLYKKSIEIFPRNPGAYNNLGIIYRNLGQIDQAIENFEWAIAYNVNFAEAYNNLGACFQDINELEKALESYKNAIKNKSDFAQAFNNIGIVYNKLGQFKDAVRNYEKAIELDERFASAYHNLSALKKFTSSDHLIEKMKVQLKAKNITKSEKIFFKFALSKAFEDIESIDEMFKNLNEANRLRKQELNYSFKITEDANKNIMSLFKPDSPIVKEKLIAGSSTPIFIVGMPRSGSTLVEQIISSHHEVFGGGELKNLSKVISQLANENSAFNDKLSEEIILSIRQKYFDSISIDDLNKNFFTDKWLLNFRNIGFIISAFPEAKIINTNRDAVATCWSIYKHYFSDNGNGWAYNLTDIAKYYGLYLDLMKFWHQRYPNKIYDVSYEDLTNNQEKETRKILEYCDLNWDENCLNFHKNNRAVKTASSLQVRKKMYQGSSEAWKKYEEYLRPLLKELSALE